MAVKRKQKKSVHDSKYKYGRNAAIVARARNMGTCPICGKVKYASRADAKAEAQRLVRLTGQRMRVYKCGRYYHHTSQSAETVAWERAREFRINSAEPLDAASDSR